MMASHLSIGNSSIGETNWMPALFTRISTRAEGLSPSESWLRFREACSYRRMNKPP